MDKPIDNYWELRLNDLKEALEANNFDVFVSDSTVQAKEIVLNKILNQLTVKSVSWGGSMTFISTGLYDVMKTDPDLEIIDTFDKKVTFEESYERRRQALLTDLFFTGTNAITAEGQLVNLDMTGNRTGAIAFGPKNVIILAGRNKIVADLEEAMHRIKNYVAPANAMRLDMPTPCAKTSHCLECKSPKRICNTWTITEKSFPKGRIKVVLINADLGL